MLKRTELSSTETIAPPPHPVLTSLCRLMGERFEADLVLITDAQWRPLASHNWPLALPALPLAALITADMLVLTDTHEDGRFGAISEALGGLRIGFCATSKLNRPDGQTVGHLYLLRREPRTFERQHYQAFLDFICLASDHLVQRQALDRAARIEAELLPYRSGVETLTDAIVAYDGQGSITYADRAAERLFGAPAFELEGQPLTLLIPSGASSLPVSGPEAWAGGQTEGRRVNGELLYLDVAGRQLQTDSSNVTLLIRDVSDRRELLASLQASQLQTEALIRAIPDTLFVLGQDGVVMRYKAGALPVEIKDAAKDPVGRSPYGLWPAGVAETVMIYVRLALWNGGVVRTFTFQLPAPEPGGEGQTVEARAVPLGTEQVLLVVRPIGQEQRLESAARQYLTLMEASADGVALLDHGHRFWYVNPTMVRRLGYEDAVRLEGQHWSVIFPREDRETVRPRVEEAMGRRDHWNGQLDLVGPQGEVLRQEVALAAFEDGNSLLVMHSFENLAREGRKPEGDDLLREAHTAET